jgi:hypothetical protein
MHDDTTNTPTTSPTNMAMIIMPLDHHTVIVVAGHPGIGA